VHAPLDRIQRDRIVRRVRREYRDRISGAQRVNSRLVRVRVCLVVRGERLEGDVEAVVGFRDVLLQVLPDGGEFLAGDADHAEIAYFAAAAEVEEGEAYDADFLVGARGAAADEAGGVFACADLGGVNMDRGLERELGENCTMRTLRGAMMARWMTEARKMEKLRELEVWN
jgi:hypothetical protein